MHSRASRSIPAISPSVLQQAATTGTPVQVFVIDGDMFPVVETVTVISVDGSSACVRRSGGDVVVALTALRDPAIARRRLNGDNWFTRLLDKVSWIWRARPMSTGSGRTPGITT